MTELVAKIGENMSVRRTIALAVEPGVVASYIHNASSPELGKIGVLVALRSTADKAKLLELGKKLAMHVAAASPLALVPEHLSKDVVDRERAVQADLARQSGKPENVIEKMLEGRMRKFYEETVLLHQTYVIDGEIQGLSGGRKGREGTGHTGRDCGFCPLSGRRGYRKARRRLRGRSEQTVRPLRRGCMSSAPKYCRVLLKVSGEALMGQEAFGIDTATVDRIAADVNEATNAGSQLCMVIGGGIFSAASPVPPKVSNAPPPTTWACLPR